MRPLADELEPVEVGHDARHHEREDALAGELARGRPGGRLELVVVELEPDARSSSASCARGRVESS